MSFRLAAFIVGLVMALVPAASAQVGIDPTFGDSGWQVTPVGERAFLAGLAVAPDGSLVAVGAAYEDGRDDIVAVRYSPDGHVVSQRTFPLGNAGDTEAMAVDVAIGKEGRILVGALVIDSGEHHGIVVALHVSLEPDPSFGAGGMVMFPVGESLADVELQADGRAVVLTSSAVWRLLPDGAVDPSFGTDGRAPHGQSWSSSHRLALQANGQIVLAGRTAGGLTLAALTPGGQPSTAFGTDGVAIAGPGRPVALAIQPDDAIVVAGALDGGGGFDATLWRFDAGGGLDPAFGTSGQVRFDLDVYDSFGAVMVQPDARIVAAGFHSDTDALEASVSTIARLLPDGTLDDTFGTGGIVQTNPAGHGSSATAVVAQPGRGIVIGANAREANEAPYRFALARVGRPANLPPALASVSATPGTLWPANHKWVDVAIGYEVTDDQEDAPVCALAVTSNQPAHSRGDGNTIPDWLIVDAHHVELRAERTAGRTRVYTVGITCTDAGGLSGHDQVRVAVAPRR